MAAMESSETKSQGKLPKTRAYFSGGLPDNSILCRITSFCSFSETEERARLRFQVELEFVQCLANPHYLNCK